MRDCSATSCWVDCLSCEEDVAFAATAVPEPAAGDDDAAGSFGAFGVLARVPLSSLGVERARWFGEALSVLDVTTRSLGLRTFLCYWCGTALSQLAVYHRQLGGAATVRP